MERDEGGNIRAFEYSCRLVFAMECKSTPKVRTETKDR